MVLTHMTIQIRCQNKVYIYEIGWIIYIMLTMLFMLLGQSKSVLVNILDMWKSIGHTPLAHDIVKCPLSITWSFDIDHIAVGLYLYILSLFLI